MTTADIARSSLIDELRPKVREFYKALNEIAKPLYPSTNSSELDLTNLDVCSKLTLLLGFASYCV